LTLYVGLAGFSYTEGKNSTLEASKLSAEY
jgi:hypothetical protein